MKTHEYFMTYYIILNKIIYQDFLVLIDFEKAFDSVSRKFINKTFEFLNFGQNIMKWVKILNTDIKSYIVQNGISSDFFQESRGCKQGDPISAYNFLLCVEIMGLMIRKEKDINGLKLVILK